MGSPGARAEGKVRQQGVSRAARDLVLTLSVTAGIFLLLLRRSISCCRPPPMPEPLPPQHQNAETLLFGLLIPAGVATVLLLPRRLDQWAAAHSPAAVADLLAACAAGGSRPPWSCWPGWPITGRQEPAGGSRPLDHLVAGHGGDGSPKGARACGLLAAGPPPGRLLAATAAVAVAAAGAGHAFAHLNGLPLGLPGPGRARHLAVGRVRLPVLRGWKGFACDLLLIALVLWRCRTSRSTGSGTSPPSRSIHIWPGDGLPRQPLPQGPTRSSTAATCWSTRFPSTGSVRSTCWPPSSS